jgi:hypothetical protein
MTAARHLAAILAADVVGYTRSGGEGRRKQFLALNQTRCYTLPIHRDFP